VTSPSTGRAAEPRHTAEAGATRAVRGRGLEDPRGGGAEVAGVEGIGYAAARGVLLDVARLDELREGARDGGRAGKEMARAIVGNAT